MKNCYFLFLVILLINCFIPSLASNLKSNSLKDENVININQDIQGNPDHKKAEYSFQTSDTDKNRYFKYLASSQPSSLITTFRIEFDSYGPDIADYKVLCVNVNPSESDSAIISKLKDLQIQDSACADGLKSEGRYDGIARLNESNTVLAIMIHEEKSGLKFSGRINLRVTERSLKTDEPKPKDDETYTLVPYSITISTFREQKVSKILFYSNSRNLQMLYAGTKPFPEKLFAGNIMNVYTNPNMVRQKYHNANIMTLVVNPSESGSNDEDFYFEVNKFESSFLLDYYVSSNSLGRPMNKPLLINMTECTDPYYVILNYNQQEGKKVLNIDQIYGKFKSLHIANDFTQKTWNEMITKDMKLINFKELKYHLPANSSAHLDVFKIECELPLMFNFYFTDETELISKMNYGDINIFTLEPQGSINVPFFDDIISPEIIVEIFNPHSIPTVVIKAQEEKVYQMNSLIKLAPMTLPNGITVKERAGLRDTRIIIKVGFPNNRWENTSDPNVNYNEYFKVYAFKFPLDQKMYNYTFAYLKTSGTNAEDNVKYCFNTNIGAALQPSSENCYRVSKENSYTLKVFNPLNMYKDYNYDSTLAYYVTFKIETDASEFTIESDIKTYDTETRNFIDENVEVTINNNKASSILTPPDSYNSLTFVQIQVCDTTNSVKAKIINPLTNDVVKEEEEIPANTKNKFLKYDNTFLDSELILTGNDNTKIFLRLAGLPYDYDPIFNENYQVTFDGTTNTINIECPLTGFEYLEYTVIIDEENELKNKKYTLCNFVHPDLDKMGKYHKTVSAYGYGSAQINFKAAGFEVGDKFDAIVYIKQRMFSTMAFLSDVIQDTVGDIAIDSIHEITEVYAQDPDYVHIAMEAKESDLNYYFTFQPDKLLDVPFGS